MQSLLAELNETKHLSQEMQAGLNKDMLDLKNVFSEKTNLLVSETETHKNELLDEIRQMNEELMKRSSKLSAQEQEIESIKENGQNKLQVAENQIQSLKEQLLNRCEIFGFFLLSFPQNERKMYRHSSAYTVL